VSHPEAEEVEPPSCFLTAGMRRERDAVLRREHHDEGVQGGVALETGLQEKMTVRSPALPAGQVQRTFWSETPSLAPRCRTVDNKMNNNAMVARPYRCKDP